MSEIESCEPACRDFNDILYVLKQHPGLRFTLQYRHIEHLGISVWVLKTEDDNGIEKTKRVSDLERYPFEVIFLDLVEMAQDHGKCHDV